MKPGVVLRASVSRVSANIKAANLGGLLSFARGLPGYLRAPITSEQAQKEIQLAVDSREERFLELVRSRIYECPESPYLRLLKLAGCDFSDLRARVHRDGLECTLAQLANRGVYLTSDEFKGKKAVVRGGQSFMVSPADFQQRDSNAGIATQSSGTRNQPLRSFLSLDRLSLSASITSAFFAAHNLFSSHHIICDAILPANGGVRILLIYAKLGVRPGRWFAQKVRLDSPLEALFHYLTTYGIVSATKWFGPGAPRPEFVDGGDLKCIVRCLSEILKKGQTCCVTAVASNGTRIAQAAWDMGERLDGTTFILGSEPVTDSKREIIERVGARVIPTYGFADGGQVGRGCGRALYTDEVHLLLDRLAVIPNPARRAVAAAEIHPLLFTTIYSAPPMLLLNVENGDYAALEKRNCGCLWESLGLSLHMHGIRSFEKLTSEGMNYFYGDLFELFEKILPAEFGGSPGDYQLVEEEEDRNGQTLLSLLVHPNVGALDEQMLIARLRERLSGGSRDHRFMANVWQNARTLRVRREVPHASPRGKILPLHISPTKIAAG